mmetsp:Transcript_47321/g.107954  ORF Transcript_47321/g.107954 Transcript_47321/m.107954 type:complete len:93 (-) Transcript_47321:99-377(-)
MKSVTAIQAKKTKAPNRKTATEQNSPSTRGLKMLQHICCTLGMMNNRPLRKSHVKRNEFRHTQNTRVSMMLQTAKRRPKLMHLREFHSTPTG